MERPDLASLASPPAGGLSWLRGRLKAAPSLGGGRGEGEVGKGGSQRPWAQKEGGPWGLECEAVAAAPLHVRLGFQPRGGLQSRPLGTWWAYLVCVGGVRLRAYIGRVLRCTLSPNSILHCQNP